MSQINSAIFLVDLVSLTLSHSLSISIYFYLRRTLTFAGSEKSGRSFAPAESTIPNTAANITINTVIHNITDGYFTKNVAYLKKYELVFSIKMDYFPNVIL